jgi:hypothetical protein
MGIRVQGVSMAAEVGVPPDVLGVANNLHGGDLNMDQDESLGSLSRWFTVVDLRLARPIRGG